MLLLIFDVSVTLLPGQKEVGPLAVITAAVGWDSCVMLKESVAEQPILSVTVTEYTPPLVMYCLLVVEPADQL